MADSNVLIVGGGIAGLACAQHLAEAGVSCRILESSDKAGGRVRTDEVDGFLLDRGFQVLLTAYPDARQLLDYDDLQLAKFEPGALVRYRGKFHRFVDPWRRPRHLLSTAVSPVGSLSDKIRVARLRRHVSRCSLDELYEREESGTLDVLRKRGFSEAVISRFFRPFLGGVFLDPALETSSRMFEFVFRMFAVGDAAIPGRGMGAIAEQMSRSLPPGTVETEKTVESIDKQTVRLESGESIRTRQVVVACEAPAAARLLGEERVIGRSVACVYFAAEQSPVKDPILVLNGEGRGPINNLCVPSQVSSSYAPRGQSLISATVLEPYDQGQLEDAVRGQLVDWFGKAANGWRHLRTYDIPFALPNQSPPALSPVEKDSRRADGLVVCGDYLDTASIQGAMASGRRAAEAVLRDFEG